MWDSVPKSVLSQAGLGDCIKGSLLPSSEYILCPENRSLSSGGSLLPPPASLPGAVPVAPHSPGEMAPCKRLAAGGHPGIGQKEARDSFLGFRLSCPCPIGVETFLSQPASPGMYGRGVAQFLSCQVTFTNQIHPKQNKTICP